LLGRLTTSSPPGVTTEASGVLELLSFLSFSFPGIVIGIGFMWFFVRTPL
jgi:iron(III) transport system permease protein